jgi:hypothetical protein
VEYYREAFAFVEHQEVSVVVLTIAVEEVKPDVVVASVAEQQANLGLVVVLDMVVVVLLQTVIRDDLWSRCDLLLLQPRLQLYVVHRVLHPIWIFRIFLLAYHSEVQRYARLSVAAGKSLYWKLLSLHTDSLAIVAGQLLEEEEKPTQQERRQNQKYQIFWVFEGEDQVFVDKQCGLGKETHEGLGLV